MKTRREDVRAKGGRPPKFEGPRRPVTVTLPERTLEQLTGIDNDRARAIVMAADAMSPGQGADHPAIEVVEALPGVGVILVGPSRYLRHIEWLRQVRVAPNRFLLVIPTGREPDSLEVALGDLVDVIPERDAKEKKMVHDLHMLLRTFRKGRKVTKAEILLVDTHR